ncbi:MAG TPA: hypothetical protein P5330_06245 [Candidatus Competibacteraceae bacterium]|nr:hypothetical protein [Candidatus Competibacteraceae bacterium]
MGAGHDPHMMKRGHGTAFKMEIARVDLGMVRPVRQGEGAGSQDHRQREGDQNTFKPNLHTWTPGGREREDESAPSLAQGWR